MKISQTLIYVSLIYICHTALHVNHKMPCSNYSDICSFYHSNYCALNFIFVSALVTYVLLRNFESGYTCRSMLTSQTYSLWLFMIILKIFLVFDFYGSGVPIIIATNVYYPCIHVVTICDWILKV